MKNEIIRSIENILNPNFRGDKFLVPISIGQGEKIQLQKSFIQKVFLREKDEIIIEGKIFKMHYSVSGTKTRKSFEGFGEPIGNYDLRNLEKGVEFRGEMLNKQPNKYKYEKIFFSIPYQLSNK